MDTFNISHKHGMNEHTGKREVDIYPRLHRLEIMHRFGLCDVCLLRALACKKRFVRLPPGRET